jgi:glycosyltransferase involved in cell wall biosynthesis
VVHLTRAARVSVVTIFLNEERFLRESIESVRAQTSGEWELVLVDDGSTDGSAAIAAEAAADDRRITCVAHPGGFNMGMSASRNLGIASSTAPIIAFLDADDVWLPQKLEEQMAIFDASPSLGMVYGRTQMWYSWNDGDERRDFLYDLGVEPGRAYEPPALFSVLMRNRAQSPTSSNAAVRRAIVKGVGGFEDEFRGMFEDQVFFSKVHLDAACHVDDRVWARYRQHERSSTAQSAGAGLDLVARDRFLKWVDRYAHERGNTNPEVRAAIRRARRDLAVQRFRAGIRAGLGLR